MTTAPLEADPSKYNVPASSRRAFLKQGAVLAAGLAFGLPWFGGCRKTASEAEFIWLELSRELKGTLLRPDYSGFAQKAAPWALQYANVLPQAIASCVSKEDVQACMRWARKHNVPLVARSGGHSYGGYSTTTGLMIDVSPMRQIRYDTATELLHVEGGARNRQVFEAGRALGLSVTHGRCFGVATWKFFLLGGAIDDKQPAETALLHRGYSMLTSIELEWTEKDSASTVARAGQWLDGFHNRRAPFTSPHSYQNFIDPREADSLHAYYGSHLQRLREVKRRYDPQNVFRFPRSIPL